MTGFTTRETKGQTGKFQSYHSPNMLIIFSEAQAIDDIIYEQAEGCLTAENNKMLLLGNPLRTSGYFARAIDDPSFFKVHLSCLDCPNVIEDREVIPGMVSKKWVDDKRKAWEAVGDPRWESRVLGIKPKVTIDNVIPMDFINRCKGKVPYYPINIRVTSADYARFGDDETIIYNWKNGVIVKMDRMAMSSGPECSSHSVIMSQENESTILGGDADGLGGPVMDFNRKALQHNDKITVVDLKGSDAATDPQFCNMRAQKWWNCREGLRKEMFCIPNDLILIEELSEVLYFYNGKGEIQIESKKDLKESERLGRSPDRADAFVDGVWLHGEDVHSRPEDDLYQDPYANREEFVEPDQSYMSA